MPTLINIFFNFGELSIKNVSRNKEIKVWYKIYYYYLKNNCLFQIITIAACVPFKYLNSWKSDNCTNLLTFKVIKLVKLIKINP